MTYRLQKTADGSDTLYSTEFDQTFHSTFGALTETHHVFVAGTGVAARLRQGLETHVLEVGFGTGLNFFATAQPALISGVALHYTALEKTLLPGPILTQLNHHHVLDAGQQLRQAFIKWRMKLPETLPPALTWEFDQTIQLTLLLGDAATIALPDLAAQAIYHDPFSPEANPELWTTAMFAKLYQVLADEGKLGTYSVKGAVRQALTAAGFVVAKRPGPPGKREVLLASKPESAKGPTG